MNLETYIRERLAQTGRLTSAEIVRATGMSRSYVHRVLQHLVGEGSIRRIGKANRARYVHNEAGQLAAALAEEVTYHRFLRNRNLQEDLILKEVKRETAALRGVPENVGRIVDYTFSEILNNAIEHSHSERITVDVQRTDKAIGFTITDRGIGIFRNIRESYDFGSDEEALHMLLKGKQTTDPKRHSGEGLFFSSRAASFLQIKSGHLRLTFDNRLPDVMIAEIKEVQGTRVETWIDLSSETDLARVFDRYSGEALTFDRTEVRIALYKLGQEHVSRSEARRVLAGLEKLRHGVFDFAGVSSLGQAFADEVFRVWKGDHPDSTLTVVNALESVRAMIRHVQLPHDMPDV